MPAELKIMKILEEVRTAERDRLKAAGELTFYAVAERYRRALVRIASAETTNMGQAAEIASEALAARTVDAGDSPKIIMSETMERPDEPHHRFAVHRAEDGRLYVVSVDECARTWRVYVGRGDWYHVRQHGDKISPDRAEKMFPEIFAIYGASS